MSIWELPAKVRVAKYLPYNAFLPLNMGTYNSLCPTVYRLLGQAIRKTGLKSTSVSHGLKLA
ncbi:hypothetical protein QFZ77_004639 [Paenibacillus sp. V4I3]|uniref:hypothetical protein n=1 Tax=unclassified Paenibacillus TaxID=185978 RepID=UPI002780C1BA|nr:MULTISPECIES: hypothetical protein [unclassified Paenibacillus]MDQ0875980.1 hypothetical protein [Paenibacillus sp. V4I3]MDQ0888004.1 hypothetical protein [Paenibacillus sp. V4I9]